MQFVQFVKLKLKWSTWTKLHDQYRKLIYIISKLEPGFRRGILSEAQ